MCTCARTHTHTDWSSCKDLARYHMSLSLWKTINHSLAPWLNGELALLINWLDSVGQQMLHKTKPFEVAAIWSTLLCIPRSLLCRFMWYLRDTCYFFHCTFLNPPRPMKPASEDSVKATSEVRTIFSFSGYCSLWNYKAKLHQRGSTQWLRALRRQLWWFE